MSSERTLLIATGNPGKVAELSEMLRALEINVVGLDLFPGVKVVAETGATFIENATLKAIGYSAQVGLPALADDSGLEVAALGGRPGVHSARYGGDAPFSEKMELLLHEVALSGGDERSARFVSSMVLAQPSGLVIAESEAVCTGRLSDRPRGSGGFGYDPLFVPDGYDQTFGELPDEIKAQISHRARAFSRMMPLLARFFGVLT